MNLESEINDEKSANSGELSSLSAYKDQGLHLCIWQTLLSNANCREFKAHILILCVLSGNQTHDTTVCKYIILVV